MADGILHVMDFEIVDICNTFLLLFPIEHLLALDARLVAHDFQSIHHFCETALVDEFLRSASRDELN